MFEITLNIRDRGKADSIVTDANTEQQQVSLCPTATQGRCKAMRVNVNGKRWLMERPRPHQSIGVALERAEQTGYNATREYYQSQPDGTGQQEHT